MRQKYSKLASFLLVLCGFAFQSHAQVIWSDNFNRGNGTLDSGVGSTELGGLLGSSVLARSQSVEQNIVNNQLAITNYGSYSTGAVRFNSAGSSLGGTPSTGLYNWASGTAGADITAAGGMVISFGWTPASTGSTWISFEAGLNDFDQQYAVVNSATDSGIIIQDNGVVQQYANGTATGTDTGFATASMHLVSLVYQFGSFSDSTPVTLTAIVDGSVAGTSSFTWNGTGGAQYLQLDTNDQTGTAEDISNFSVSALPEPGSFGLAASAAAFGLLRRRKRTA